ncbi:hypothetical protein LINPERHAP1_LOCUS7829 [Linum perenne]
MTGEVEDPSLLLSSQPSTKTSSSISSKSRRTHNAWDECHTMDHHHPTNPGVEHFG